MDAKLEDILKRQQENLEKMKTLRKSLNKQQKEFTQSMRSRLEEIKADTGPDAKAKLVQMKSELDKFTKELEEVDYEKEFNECLSTLAELKIEQKE